MIRKFGEKTCIYFKDPDDACPFAAIDVFYAMEICSKNCSAYKEKEDENKE